MSRPNRRSAFPSLPSPPDRPALPRPAWDRDGRVPWCPACRRCWFPERLDGGACPACGDDVAVREADPFDVVPADLLDEYDAETVAEAVAEAERDDGTTDPADEPRCPSCFSRRIAVKPGVRSYDHKIETDHKCRTCQTHFDEPLAPRSKLPEGESVCASCGSRLLRLLTRGRVRCLNCETEHKTATAAEDDVTDRDRTPETVDAAEDDVTDRDRTPATDAAADQDPTPDPIMPRKLETPTEEYGIPTGDDLRELREALDLSLRDVPVAAGSTLGRWERGEVAPRLDRLEELVEYYRTVDAVRRAARADAALGDRDVEPEPEEEGVGEAAPASPEADPFDWVEEADLRAATDGGRR